MKNSGFGGRLLVACGLAALLFTPAGSTSVRVEAPQAQAPALPDRLTDAEFWNLLSEISEPGGYFRITDNYTSNEREVGEVQTLLRERGIQGGVYLGVGPEQNFSYIAAIRPDMAFIVDIRRQAVIQHLMFKALFELADDRAEFIALLFSLPRPEGLGRGTPIQQIWQAFAAAEMDRAAAERTYARIVERLTETHGFALTAEETAQLESVFEAFQWYGPAITTRGSAAGRRGNQVTFADLTGWAHDAAGQPQSFLASEDHYQYIKALQEKNLIVPASGDFAGPKTIRGIGEYLRTRGGAVSAFYVSNVEQYLFQDRKSGAFYANVAALPMTDDTVFIRPYALRRVWDPARRSGVALCRIRGFLQAVDANEVFTNTDALACGGR
jgi:hypothetical protein